MCASFNEADKNDFMNMRYPTSKQPNPSKFHHNNRCLIPFHTKKLVKENRTISQVVTDRTPGQFIKLNDGKFTYQIQDNGLLIKVGNVNPTA